MNHLGRARDALEYGISFKNTDKLSGAEIALIAYSKAHALIAIAEELELTGKGIFAGLSGIDKRLNKIAEQLEKMYDAEHMTDREFAIKYGEDK